MARFRRRAVAGWALAAALIAGGAARAQVQVQALGKLDLFSTGREAGLGHDLWKGASADIARAVIPTLASRPLSPAGVALARQALAQAATAPDGAGSDADLAAARARALLALGEPALADSILDHTPGLADNAALSQTAADAALITGQDAKACGIADALGGARDQLYWLKLRTYCQFLAGKADLAQLTFTLATTAAGKVNHDPEFTRMMGVALNGAGDPGPASLRTALDMALSRKLKLDLNAALPGAPPAIAAQIAADNASLAGAAPTTLSEPDIIAGVRGAKGFSAFVAAAKIARPGIAALVQAKSPMTDPVLEASAALAAGDLDDAQTIRAGLVQDTIPGASRADLALLDAALAAAAGRNDGPSLDKLSELGAAGDPKSRGRAQAAAAILAALGAPMADAARAEFLSFDLGRSEVSAARLLALDEAADTGRPGETILMALLVAQASGSNGPNPGDRARIIRALDRVGLKSQAQTYAVEGLLGLQAR